MATSKSAITNNAMVTASKQTVTDETGKVVKALYYIVITTEKGSMTINTGDLNYNKVKTLTK